MKRAALAGMIVLGALCMYREAPGQDADTPPEKLAELPSGAKVRVTGKYGELVGHELSLVDFPVPFLLNQQELLKKLLDFKSQKDNLVVMGTIVESPGGKAVEVQDLNPAPSDAEVFAREFEGTLKVDEKERGRAMFGLLRRIALYSSKYRDPECQALARKVAAECVRADTAALGPEDFAGRFQRIQDVQAQLRDRGLIIEFLVELDKQFPGRAEVRDALLALNCRKYQGRWVTYEEFKRLEGFLVYEGKWMLPREKDLIETMKVFGFMNQTNLILRKRTEREYKLMAEKGQVEDGMKPEEVYIALGFPDRVERRASVQKEFDQWTYGNKYYYFYGGLLVKQPAK